ncbi:hypothetical protein IC575_007026 [Cucumis melo]|uniref:UPF0481 protein At3g47200-like n=1 Tax=Cucumis melo TaxID=3656 RepID=A0A1S4DW65_CUCME|nr:UPF0481 protein At3g47200-like [Cucumis melo]XP_050938159.1 UPF0481 protein At3g47200-like [Cucumis melo]
MENSEIIETKVENDICDDELGETISEIEKVCDNVVISIDKILGGLPRINPKCHIIYQVSKELREMNDKAYAPQFISIGPFHHRTRNDLIANEHYKLQGFNNFLHRINNYEQIESSKEFVKKCHGWVKEAWNCYAEPINMNEEEFVLMMLVDACFILEFFILLIDDHYGGDYLFEADQIFQIQDMVDFSFYRGVFFEILIDLIKLENQVPFFLLQNLFDLMPKHDVPMFPSLIDITSEILTWFGFVGKYKINDLYHKKPKHLLDFLSFYFFPLLPNDDHIRFKQNERKNSDQNNNNLLRFFRPLFPAHWLKKNNDSFGVPSLCCFSNKEAETREKDSENYFRLSPPSITELCEAGVTIKAAKREDLCFMNIGFKNGVLEIPCIDIDCTFEVVIRNVIAFDQYPAGNEKMYAIHYVLFLDDLINTEQDAHLLTKAGIIINTFGGSDKDITEMFNRFSKFVTFPICSHFDDINKALRMHCNGRWNMAKASLKHNYFNTPWAIISFGAATFLIILTILQTIFSAISTFRN